MSNLVSDDGIRYLWGLRSDLARKEDDTEAKKIAIELPDVPLLTHEDNPCKYDLVFVCSDGLVFAHRLVISSVSKYIMNMLDDQPPWYTTYIHVLDLPNAIVQLLVDLAYTGEMRLTQAIQSDVVDAMHTLGWVHTDCLSADFDLDGEDSKSPKKEEKDKQGTPKMIAETENDGVKVSSSLREKKSLQRPKATDFSAEDEDCMEISQLPDVNLSDSEDGKSIALSTSNALKDTADKRGARRGRPPGNSKSKAKDKNVPTKLLKEPEKLPSRKSTRRASSSETTDSATGSTTVVESSEDIISTESKQKTKGRADAMIPAAVNVEPKAEDMLVIDDTSQVSTINEGSSLLDSPSKRQRRKPKRFEEYEELEKPKPRASPAKPTAEMKVSRGKKATNTKPLIDTVIDSDLSHIKVQSTESSIDEVDEVLSKGALAGSSGTTGKNSKAKVVPKRKLSTETAKHSLITSYFKKDSAKVEPGDSSDLSQECVEINSSTTTTSLSELEGNNELDTNDNKLSTPTLPSSSKASLRERKKPGNGSIQNDEILEISSTTTVVDENRDSKKRSFDEIRSSHIEESGIIGPETRENGEELEMDKKPARKSSRVASKAQSTDDNEGKNGEEDAPKRKRSRKESTDAVITNSKDSVSDPPSRRSSKQ